jgi:predicted dehydrogenase
VSDITNKHDMSRRAFAARLGAAATIVAGRDLLRPWRVSASQAAPGRILGANDRVIAATIGIRGQGNALKRGFARLPNVEIKTLCDIDANLAAERINDSELADVTTFKPAFEQDLRRVLDDKDVDAVLEGRRMVDAARRYNRLVQVGTMNRTRPAVREAIKFLHDGGLGKLYMARGLCFKPRPSIGKYPDGPMNPGEEYRLNVEAKLAEPAYDPSYLQKVDYDLWLGPAPKRPFNRNRFHYNWHWHWDYGDGDTGNQGPHQFDIARWGLSKQEHPVRVTSMGGYFGPESSQETPDIQTSILEYADKTILEFATRGQHTNDEGTQRIGNLFYGSEGWLWIDGDGRKWQSYLGRKEEKGPGMDLPASQGGSDPRFPTSIETPHYQNFIDAIRAGDSKLLNADILEGHMSATLNHLANIAYRVGRPLRFDGRTERFVDDKQADRLLTREYRKGFELPGTT